FGINVSCARCHDHPKVDDWKMDHYFGMKSFFNRTYNANGFVAEREYGAIKFKASDGKEKMAKMMFFTGKAIDAPGMKEPTREEQQKEKTQIEEYKRKKMAPPPPKFSARAQLASLALQPGEREFFARAIVNRLWYQFFGHGLVMPLDQM